MRKVIVATVAAVVLLTPTAALAASNPSGSGQPSLECGFATAEDMYAGSDGTASLASGSDAAVSQYDVACFQMTQAGR
jgi:hypothetical protein